MVGAEAGSTRRGPPTLAVIILRIFLVARAFDKVTIIPRSSFLSLSPSLCVACFFSSFSPWIYVVLISNSQSSLHPTPCSPPSLFLLPYPSSVFLCAGGAGAPDPATFCSTCFGFTGVGSFPFAVSRVVVDHFCIEDTCHFNPNISEFNIERLLGSTPFVVAFFEDISFASRNICFNEVV